jgi:hypothetical protein
LSGVVASPVAGSILATTTPSVGDSIGTGKAGVVRMRMLAREKAEMTEQRQRLSGADGGGAA